MISNFDPKSVVTAGRVARFLDRMAREHRDRWDAVQPCCIPFGDLAYGTALMKWYQDGCPKDAWFSYASEQIACPYLLAFREEVVKEFGLRILTAEESKAEEMKHATILTRKVHDWGSN